jgi:hypothetical protein
MILTWALSYCRSSRVALFALTAPLLADRGLQEDQWVAEVEEVWEHFKNANYFPSLA